MDFSIKVFPDFRYLVKLTLYHFQLNRFDRLYLEIERFHYSNSLTNENIITILLNIKSNKCWKFKCV